MAKTKRLISFDELTFNQYMDKWKKKKELEKQIIEKTKFILGDFEFKPSDLFPSPQTKIFKLIEKAFIDSNPMGLSGEKLAELKEINVDSLLNNQLYEYRKYVSVTNPHLDDFSKYAVTDEEIQRLDDCETFIKAYKSFFGPGENITIHQMNQISQATNTRIVRGMNNELMANPSYVKNAI